MGDWERLAPYAHKAAIEIAKYDTYLGLIPNANLLLTPLMTNEAVSSSRIEGTRASEEDVFALRADSSPEDTIPNDTVEVLNYLVAMEKIHLDLVDHPITSNIIKNAHANLVMGARGQYKSPGRYRESIIHIGSPDSTIETATFIPIGPNELMDAIAKWERYINEDSENPIVKAAIAHAEFESIHPFMDGNGRMGRMLVPLMLWKDGAISNPHFYISAYFDAHRDSYYDLLLGVSKEDDWTKWCIFFLEAVEGQAKANLKKAKIILDLYEDIKNRLLAQSGSPYAPAAVDYIFNSPIFTTTSLYQNISASKQVGGRLIKVMEDLEMISLFRAKSGRRPAAYAFSLLIDAIARG